jgi:TolA-binding protein
VLWLVPAAAAACLAVGLALFAWLGTDDEGGAQVARGRVHATRFQTGRAPVTEVLESSTRVLAVPAGERMLARMGRDRVGVDGGGRIAFVAVDSQRTELHLEQGWIACAVATGSDRSRFFTAVGGGRFTVEVKGTRFAVRYVPAPETGEAAGSVLQVAVAAGQVTVGDREDRRWLVSAAEQLDMDAGGRASIGPITRAASEAIERLLSEEEQQAARGPLTEADTAGAEAVEPSVDAGVPEPAAVDGGARGHRPAARPVQDTDTAEPAALGLEEIEAFVVAGEYARARAELETRVAAEPSNSRMWRLLADCRRKTGDVAGAVAALENVIRYGPPAIAAAARFRAGVLLQDRLARQARAAEMFEEYLTAEGPKPLSAEAWLRLGKAWQAVGKRDQARGAFEKVVERHGGTAAAVEARDLLSAD